MWRVYKHTGKDKDYDAYKEALNAATNEVRKTKRKSEELNMHFSSVFTREYTISLPVPETKFEGSVGERLGQLVVTPEVVANKINNMKENKSQGVDGIAPKILKETVEQNVYATRTRV